MVVGSPSGQTIICTVTEVISKVIDSGMDLQDAVDSPRFYDGASMVAYGGATGFVYEATIDKSSIKKLEEMGHLLIEKDGWSQGTTQAIQLMDDGTLRGAADPRDYYDIFILDTTQKFDRERNFLRPLYSSIHLNRYNSQAQPYRFPETVPE